MLERAMLESTRLMSTMGWVLFSAYHMKGVSHSCDENPEFASDVETVKSLVRRVGGLILQSIHWLVRVRVNLV